MFGSVINGASVVAIVALLFKNYHLEQLLFEKGLKTLLVKHKKIPA
jgi:hypothetical protein